MIIAVHNVALMAIVRAFEERTKYIMYTSLKAFYHFSAEIFLEITLKGRLMVQSLEHSQILPLCKVQDNDSVAFPCNLGLF